MSTAGIKSIIIGTFAGALLVAGCSTKSTTKTREVSFVFEVVPGVFTNKIQTVGVFITNNSPLCSEVSNISPIFFTLAPFPSLNSSQDQSLVCTAYALSTDGLHLTGIISDAQLTCETDSTNSTRSFFANLSSNVDCESGSSYNIYANCLDYTGAVYPSHSETFICP